MTDPKKLADRIRDDRSAIQASVWREITETLDAYARILAASPDVREIEERNLAAIAEVEALDPLAGIVVTRAQKDCATLLDVVRRKDAEIERLRKANETFISETWKTERELIHAANQERDAARTALQEERERRERIESVIRSRMTAEELTWRAFEKPAVVQDANERIMQIKKDAAQEAARLRAELAKERERHAGTRARLARLERAEEGVRLYRGPDRFNVVKVAEWEREHGATASPCYCAETSTRNCPRHQNGETG